MTQAVLSLAPEHLHVRHYLAGRIAKVRHELFVQLNQPGKAITELANTVHPWQNVQPCREAAFALERLGNAYTSLGMNNAAAKMHYQSYSKLSLLSGQDNAYVKCAARFCAQSLLKIPMRSQESPGLEGERVLLVGLAKRATLNGSVGLCGSLESGRFPVRLEGHKDGGVRVKTENLLVMQDGQLEPHALVVVHGLVSETGGQLNAHVGTLAANCGQRWSVWIQGQGAKSIKPGNLCLLPALREWFEWSSAKM